MDYAFQSDSKLFFVLEYCPGGELFFYLSQIGRFKEDAARFYASNILLALHHLHSQNILYRDLKPENVLVSHDGYVKIADFGLSKENIFGHNEAKSICGTAEYLAPEILLNQGHGKASDWWSFGGIIYEMLCGEHPFEADNDDELYSKIQHARFTMEGKGWDNISDSAKDLVRKILVVNPTDRVSASEAITHPWLVSAEHSDVASHAQEAAKGKNTKSPKKGLFSGWSFTSGPD
jgi:protein-serine/threonine kinase